MANYGPPGGPYPGPSQPWNDPDRQTTDEYGQPVDPWGEQDQAGGAGQWGGGQPSAPPGGPGSPVSHPGYPAGYPGPAGPGAAPTPGAPGAGYAPTRRHDVGHAPPPHHSGGSAPYGAPPGGWTASDADPVWATPAPDPSWSTSTPDPMPKGRGNRAFVAVLVGLAVLVLGGAAIGVYLLNRDEPPADAQPSTTEQTEEPADQASLPAEPAPTTAPAAPPTDARFVKAGQCVRNEGTEATPKLAITNCAPQTYEVLARYNGATTGAQDAKTKCAQVRNYTNFYFFNSELDELDFVLCLRKR
ncbi:LppU/SCO3897 family protein [Plantactinospora sp. CA-294935]|uniref:LppU/SCO3897 family protein n=1 Tax=Plantactinospora sp. CA-294935 TaxID=3240012 RepID=UPI003D913F2D